MTTLKFNQYIYHLNPSFNRIALHNTYYYRVILSLGMVAYTTRLFLCGLVDLLTNCRITLLNSATYQHVRNSSGFWLFPEKDGIEPNNCLIENTDLMPGNIILFGINLLMRRNDQALILEANLPRYRIR